MSAPRVTTAMRINALSDEARAVAAYAAGWDLDLESVTTEAHTVTAYCRTFDHANRLADGFNLWMTDHRKHEHGGLSYLHSRWSSGDSPVVVTNASLMADVGARAS